MADTLIDSIDEAVSKLLESIRVDDTVKSEKIEKVPDLAERVKVINLAISWAEKRKDLQPENPKPQAGSKFDGILKQYDTTARGRGTRSYSAKRGKPVDLNFGKPDDEYDDESEAGSLDS